MENKTALQQAFSDLEEMQPHLLNTFSQQGREFVYHFHKYLEIEKQQIMNAFEDGQSELSVKDKEEYYNETFKN
jgi:predicted RNA-binding protein with RPS1 domain